MKMSILKKNDKEENFIKCE